VAPSHGGDEAEDVEHAGDEGGEHVEPPAGPLRLRHEGVQQQPDHEEECREPDRQCDQGDHEAATLRSSMNLVAIIAQVGIHDPRPSSAPSTRPDPVYDVGRGHDSDSPNRPVTLRDDS